MPIISTLNVDLYFCVQLQLSLLLWQYEYRVHESITLQRIAKFSTRCVTQFIGNLKKKNGFLLIFSSSIFFFFPFFFVLQQCRTNTLALNVVQLL